MRDNKFPRSGDTPTGTLSAAPGEQARAVGSGWCAWRKSSRSALGCNCIEFQLSATGGVAVRDSKDPDGPALSFSVDAWIAFVKSVRAGEFDDR